jgi:aminoglycoside adenylyltransferase-like protein/nucleotidyltransferase-like protein
MREPLHPTPYADVNDALRDLLARVRATLGTQFVGMYLTGSLALGDFDPAGSDIDLVVVTEGTLSASRIEALRGMHERFAAGASPWAGKVEAVYIPCETLRRAAPDDAGYPQVEKGHGLFVDQLESGWIVQCYILREHGVALAGPDPRTLLDPLDPDAMRRAVLPIPVIWLGLAYHDPAWLDWLRERGNQAFVVLTLCRLLYTLATGGVASKPGAARWAQQTLGGRWTGVPARPLARQHAGTPIPDSDLMETVALIGYTVQQFRQWEARHGGDGSALDTTPAGDDRNGRPGRGPG